MSGPLVKPKTGSRFQVSGFRLVARDSIEPQRRGDAETRRRRRANRIEQEDAEETEATEGSRDKQGSGQAMKRSDR